MKRAILIIAGVLAVLVAAVYLFVPPVIDVKQSAGIRFPRNAIERYVFNDSGRAAWWPTANVNGFSYTVTAEKNSSLSIDIGGKGAALPSDFQLFFYNKDSVIVQWTASLPASGNPFKKIGAITKAKNMERSMAVVLDSLRAVFSSNESVYGFVIKDTLLRDSIVLFTERSSSTFPSTEFIYEVIHSLQESNARGGAVQNGYPMLNVERNDNGWVVKAAIPVNQRIATEAGLSNRLLLKNSRILMAEVRGGPATINQAYRQVEMFLSDRDNISPAMPFLSLVTDRMQEKDTSKWVTRIFYPIM